MAKKKSKKAVRKTKSKVKSVIHKDVAIAKKTLKAEFQKAKVHLLKAEKDMAHFVSKNPEKAAGIAAGIGAAIGAGITAALMKKKKKKK